MLPVGMGVSSLAVSGWADLSPLSTRRLPQSVHLGISRDARLATRNTADVDAAGVSLIDLWPETSWQ